MKSKRIRPRSNVLNISLNNTEHLLSAKCSERLTTLLSLVHPCWVKFDCDQTFHWTNVERLNISFVFRDVECCSVRLTSHWTFVQFARAQWVIVSAKFSLVQQNVQHVWPPSNWTSLNNTQLCWTNVQCCSVKMFSTFDQGLSFRPLPCWLLIQCNLETLRVNSFALSPRTAEVLT